MKNNPSSGAQTFRKGLQKISRAKRRFGNRGMDVDAKALDLDFYKTYYSDIRDLSDFEAVEHYVDFGAKEERHANGQAFIEHLQKSHEALPADFDSDGYMQCNADLRMSLLKPWQPAEHYLVFGRSEERVYRATTTVADLELFDAQFYRGYYTDLASLDDTGAAAHYETIGKAEGRFPNMSSFFMHLENETKGLPDDFKVDEYLALNTDLRKHLPHPWQAVEHYLRYGRAEGRAYSKRKEVVYDLLSLNQQTVHAYDMPDVVVDPSRPPTVNVLVPAFDFGSMSAGFFGVFQVALFIKRCGLNVRLVMYDRFDFDEHVSREKLKNYPGMEKLLDELEFEYIGERATPLRISDRDNCVATVWYSAYFAQKIMRHVKAAKFLYLIQDYESVFYPSGTHFALADRTYSFDYAALFSSEALQNSFIVKKIGVFAGAGTEHAYFNNACASVLKSKEEFVGARKDLVKRRLAFYSRPPVDRNMFQLGALALCHAVREGVFDTDKWEFIGIGLGAATIRLSDDTDMRQMERMNLKEYQEVISTFDIGFCLMASPHPSLLPFDLSGSGAVVVTNSFAGVKDQAYFDKITKGVLVAEPDVHALVDALRVAVAKCEDLDQRYLNAQQMSFPRTWEETFTQQHVDHIRSVFIDTVIQEN